MFESILNPIFSPLLRLNPFWAILIIALGISVLITLAYKYLTDQEKMKSLKEELKIHQKKMKEHKDDPKKMMEMQKKAMESNFAYMKHSFKPTLFTIVPIIIIFGWLNLHIGYYPITPGAEFTTTAVFEPGVRGDVELIVPNGIEIIDEPVKDINATVSWELKGEEGEYLLKYEFDDKSFEKDILITSEREYKKPELKVKDDELKKITISNEPVKPFGSISLFGWKPGWLGTYIIFSIIFSMGLRKILKLH